jgi:AcrR family transcriptional regulator
MNRKQALVDAAIKLFAANGFNATSTASIAQYAGVTEPLIHYHFKNKDGLFTHILEEIFSEYFDRFDALPAKTPTEFDKLMNLIRFHFRFAEDYPDQTFIVMSACPAKLQDAAHICAQYVAAQGNRLSGYIAGCLERGIQTGEFRPVEVKATTGLLLAMVNGLIRRKSLKLDEIDGLLGAVLDFCRHALCADTQGS